jgi:hypothetical protein
MGANLQYYSTVNYYDIYDMSKLSLFSHEYSRIVQPARTKSVPFCIVLQVNSLLSSSTVCNMVSTCFIRSGGIRRTIRASTSNSRTKMLLSPPGTMWSSSRRSFFRFPEGLVDMSPLLSTSGSFFLYQQRALASTSPASVFYPRHVVFTSSKTICFGALSLRPFSSSAATAPTLFSTATSDDAKKNMGNNKDNKDNSSLFFDNLGKIFLLVIASVIASLVRSSAGSRNRIVLRDALEDIALVDPMELEELRLANSAFDPDTFRVILKHVHQSFPQGTCTYQDFIHCVRKAMAQVKGEAFTVELGHLLDRLMVQVLKRHEVADDSSNVELPVILLLTSLTMALYSDAKERIRILYEILQLQEEQSGQQSSNLSFDNDGSSPGGATVTIDQVRSMVGYLQDTCQLPPDTQIVPTETKYPTQQWKRGSPRDLVPWSGKADSDLIDLYTFASILRSKSVCAWGECYYKRKFEEEDV